MVDTEKRLKAARLIGQLISREITNYQYDDQFPRGKHDPALHAIYTALWFTYSDVREHRLEGKHALQPEAREIAEQCILFLKSNLEYTGRKTFIDLAAPFKRLWNFVAREKSEVMPKYWPFDSEEQLRSARAN